MDRRGEQAAPNDLAFRVHCFATLVLGVVVFGDSGLVSGIQGKVWYLGFRGEAL